MEVRIVSMPPGEAPDDIRQAWVGLVLPLHQSYPSATSTRGFGVRSGPKNMWLAWFRGLLGGGDAETGYIVDAQIAFERLARHAPHAAEWWRENTPHLFKRGQCLLFAEQSGELVEEAV